MVFYENSRSQQFPKDINKTIFTCLMPNYYFNILGNETDLKY